MHCIDYRDVLNTITAKIGELLSRQLTLEVRGDLLLSLARRVSFFLQLRHRFPCQEQSRLQFFVNNGYTHKRRRSKPKYYKASSLTILPPSYTCQFSPHHA